MWATILTIFKRRQTLRTAGLLALCVALITTLLFDVSTMAAPGINRTISFQGRLQYSTGGAVADGFYNMQFKIYQDGTRTSGGTLEWTENYVNNNNEEGVEVKNGYFSVELGTNNPFASQVDWNQDTLWLTMNVAGSADNCTTFNSGACVADGEMNPRQRFTSTPYSLNSGALEGKTASNFVQLSQGVQNDTANNSSSIFINKTGTDGNFALFQDAGTDVLTINRNGNILFGASGLGFHGIGVETSADGLNGEHLGIIAGNGGNGADTTGGALVLQGGSGGGTGGNGGNVMIDGGSSGTESGNLGSVYIGTTATQNVVIGGMATENITIGGGESANQNVTIGTGSNANSGTTTIQSKDDTVVSTNGTQRARFSGTGNTLYVGNADASGNATTANTFTIQGTSSTGSNTQGGSLNLQAGSATSGNANGGNLTLSGGSGVGTGANGLVVISTPTFSTTSNDANCFTSGALVASTCTVTAASINNTSAIIIGFSATGQTANIPDPTNTTAGRIVYITAANGSSDFTLSLNGGGTGNLTSMRQNTSATLIWNGSDWTVAGASNSTTLQSAYDNTLQSAGGAEIIVSNSANANGLTIRDSITNSVNGTLLEVQNSSASTLFSVNSNVPEYATNGGAEQQGASSTTFPASTWGALGTATVTRQATTGPYIASGQGSVKVVTIADDYTGVHNRLNTTLAPNTTYNVSVSAKLETGSFNQFGIYYTSDGDAGSATVCKEGNAVITSGWKKFNCSFTTPASGITSSNTILLGQVDSTARTFYIDNLSVTIAGNQNYATDGNVNSQTSFDNSLWSTTGTGSTVVRVTNDGQEKSDSAQATTSTGGTYRGIRNQLAIKPLANTLYRVSVYAKSSTSFNDFSIRYTLDGSTFTECVDYNTQAVSTSVWTEISCYIKTPVSDSGTASVHFTQAGSAARIFRVDAFEMTLATNTVANVQIGGGSNGGQTTLFTLDQGGSAPIADNNDTLFGSMYYDTTLGKIQCYEADGWGACGSSPDNVVTISPEYNNAVMSGTGVGTMTSDFCSDTLNINDGSAGQPSICATGQTYNLYKWTSPQTTNQTYSIYVTYQLPATFKSFTSGSTSLKGRTDDGSNGGTGTVQYTVYRNNGTSLDACGSAVAVSTGTETDWQTGKATGTADPSTCGFQPGESIVFKIDMTANRNAIAYVSNLGFTFSNN